MAGILPERAGGAGAPPVAAAEFAARRPDLAWITNRFPDASFLWFITVWPVVVFSLLGGGPRLLNAVLFPIVGLPLMLLPMAVPEWGYGVTLLFPGKGGRGPTRVVMGSRVRRAGRWRVGIVAGLVALGFGLKAFARYWC